MFSRGSRGQTTRVKDHEIFINSPYKDMVLIVGHPLENDKIPLNGYVKFSINVDKMVIKRVSLKLTGQFKLEFVQMGTKNSGNATKGVAVVKERSPIFECQWDNLLKRQDGEVTMHINSIDQPPASPAGNVDSGIAGKNRFKLKRNGSSGNGTVIVDVTPESINSVIDQPREGAKVQYRFTQGEYVLAFRAMLPADIPASIEGLQSGSILYTLESNIDCKYNTFSSSGHGANEFDNDGNGSTGPSGVSISNSSNLMGTYNAKMSQYHTYKYLRILRTMAGNDMNLDEEMVVSNTLRDRLQYEIKVPSRAIALGSGLPVDIKIFPFSKGIKLNKISVTMLQQYFMKDLKGSVYDNEIVIFKKSMRSFGSLLLDDSRLYKELILNSVIQLPDDLKSVTQSCSIRDEKYIQVQHKLKFQLQFKRYDTDTKQWKNLEIRATIPIIIYISPHVNIRGRLVFYDQMNGKIHFRSGEMVELFGNGCHNNNTNSTNNTTIGRSQYEYYDEDMSGRPPPTYEEYNRDQLVVLPTVQASVDGVDSVDSVNGSDQDGLSTMSNSASGTIPSYEQATS